MFFSEGRRVMWQVAMLLHVMTMGDSGSFSSAPPYALDITKNCGAVCTLFIDHYLKGTRDFDTVAAAVQIGPRGTTFANVKRSLEKFGYHVAPPKKDGSVQGLFYTKKQR